MAELAGLALQCLVHGSPVTPRGGVTGTACLTFRLLYRELVPGRRAGCFGTGAGPKLRVWRREGDSSLYQTTICENLRHLRLQIFAASRLRLSFPCAFDEVDKVTDKARDEVGDCPCPLSPSLRHSASFIISF